jgi:hypothetical protein
MDLLGGMPDGLPDILTYFPVEVAVDTYDFCGRRFDEISSRMASKIAQN